MTPLTFAILVGGSMLVTSIVWLLLVAISILEYKRASDGHAGVT